MSYNGLTETSTNELGQTKSVTKDAMGREASITDHLGTTLVYAYDALGQMSSMQVQGVAGTTSTYAYDARGNKVSDSDPDKGTWTYSYNALGQVALQTDAKGQVTAMTYDLLARMLTRIDDATAANPSERTATWVYDTAPMGVGGPAAKGKLASVAMPNYQATFAYDGLLRDSGMTETIEGSNYAMSTAYDAASRPSTVTYPSGITIQNSYNAQGYLTQVSNQALGTAYWTAGTADARGNITTFTLGNGVQTTKAYDAQRGWLKSIVSQKGSDPLLQNLTYTFNQIGNLTRRGDGELGASPLTETIAYDGLNRLTQSYTNQAGSNPWSSTVNVAYDVLGNITSKSDVGAYAYGSGSCGGGSHAVTSVTGSKNATYCYDANGNMVSGDNRSIAYTAFDLPTGITKGNITTSFFYGPDRARYKRTDLMPDRLTTTIYAAGGAYEKILRSDGALEHKTYVGGFAIVTARTSMGTTTTTTAYVLTDHLGSIDTLSNEAGALLQKMSFDAWGKRRQQDWTVLASPLYFDVSITTRGFTGHEEIDPVGLVHMNGRVYDPELGRFLSADPFVQDGSNAQSWNRYSYVLNNPLSLTDPTGFFFGSIFKAIGNFIGSVFKAVVSLIKSILKIPLLRSVIQIIACLHPVSCVAAAGIMAAAMGGSIGDIIQAMAMSAAQIGVWHVVGIATTAIQTAMEVTRGVLNGAAVAFGIVKGAIHGVVGGAISLAQGGRFIDGFVANAVGAFAGVASESVFGPAGTGGTQGFFGRVATAAIAGGSAAELTGGKFANGALTAAFAQAFNAEASAFRQAATRAVGWMLGTRPALEAFGPGTVQVDELMNAPGTVAAREFFYAKNAEALARGSFDGLKPVTGFRSSFGFLGYIKATIGLNATQHFVGSYSVNIHPIPGGRGLLFSLSNNSSFTSFSYGAGPSWESGPMRNYRQVYHWTEPVAGQ